MIKYDLKNRVAIVTGGAQGFGLAITERFIKSGAKVKQTVTDTQKKQMKRLQQTGDARDAAAIFENFI